MPPTNSQETCIRNLCKKLALKIWCKSITVSCTTATGQPIALHGSCHVLDCFCPGTELCSVACKKLVPEKNLYKIDRHTCKFLEPNDLHKFLVLQVSWACVAGISLSVFLSVCLSMSVCWPTVSSGSCGKWDANCQPSVRTTVRPAQSDVGYGLTGADLGLSAH